MISIVIPVYNVEAYITKCLDSCFAQSYTDLEVLAVDDGSTDNSGLLLDKYATNEPRLKVFHQKNQGVVVARNNGVHQAQGKWIMFVDSDDMLIPDALETVYNQAAETDADIITASLQLLWPDGSTRIIEQPNGQFSGQEYFEMLFKAQYLWGPVCKLFKRTLFDSTIEIPRDIRIGEDFMTNMIIATKVNSVVSINTPIYLYRKLSGSTVYTHQYGTDYWIHFIDILSEKLKAQNVELSDFAQLFYKFKLNISFTIITSGLIISDKEWINNIGHIKDVKLTKKELIASKIMFSTILQRLFFFLYKKLFLRKL